MYKAKITNVTPDQITYQAPIDENGDVNYMADAVSFVNQTDTVPYIHITFYDEDTEENKGTVRYPVRPNSAIETQDDALATAKVTLDKMNSDPHFFDVPESPTLDVPSDVQAEVSKLDDIVGTSL